MDTPSPVASAPFDAGRLCDVVGDLREYVLKPNMTTTHRGASWTTNSRGMRDREYETSKPEGTLRIAARGRLLQSVPGWGVEDGQGFEPLLERHHSLWRARSRTGRRDPLQSRRGSGGGAAEARQYPGGVEVLNFSVPGHAPGQRWEHFRRNGWPMSPDLVIFEATPADPGWDERRLRGLLARNIGWDADIYASAIAASGAKRGGDFETYKAALKPHRWAILDNVYRAAVKECRDHAATAAWVLIPRVGKPIDPAERARLVKLAAEAGFAIVIDLSDAFDGLDPASLAIAPDDFHPNARGHALLAKRLEAALRAHPISRSLVEGSR